MPRSWGTLRLRSAKEVEIDSRSNHTDVCKVRAGSDLYKECLTLLREIMREAPERIAKETKPSKYIEDPKMYGHLHGKKKLPTLV